MPIKYKFDTQLLIVGSPLTDHQISEEITKKFVGDSLIVGGDANLMKIHFHTNQPWQILEYGASLGEIFDVVVENMARQEAGLKG